jgi:3-phenylpropionate/trans-cinnamate dioxygenase ferredoxin subunit
LEKITTIKNVPVGESKSFKIKDKEILIANVDGQYYAIDNRCSHMGGDLSKGTLEEDIVTCPRHGSRFNVRTGEAVKGPKILIINLRTKNLNSYPLKIKENDILIDI